MAICKSCGAKAGFLSELCRECEDKASQQALARAREVDAQSHQRKADQVVSEGIIAAAAPAIPLSTTPTLPGREIASTVGVVTAECVFGMNLLRDVMAAVTDLTGGRSRVTEAVLRDARAACLADLKLEATRIGADAVVGVQLDYSEFSGGGKSMLMLVANGTAVRLIKAHPGPH